jgi:hypothetical protein
MSFVIKSITQTDTFYKCDKVSYFKGWSKASYGGERLMTDDMNKAYKFRFYHHAEKLMNRLGKPSMSIVFVEENDTAVEG